MNNTKKFLAALVLAFALILTTACESSREIPTQKAPQGEEIKCIGITEKGASPGIEYELSTRNTVVGVIFFQTVFTPIIVLAKETYCPVADTTVTKPADSVLAYPQRAPLTAPAK